MSDKVIHFTRGSTIEEAFSIFRRILSHQQLLAGSNMIKGQYRCVCFTEAPVASVAGALPMHWNHGRYSPFGFMFEKEWLFQLGARPVIYQSDEEFDLLPESHRWRHVRYQPRSDASGVDFTWEREWRLPAEALKFDPWSVTLVVPDQSWCDRLILAHNQEEDWRVIQHSQIMEPLLAEQYRDRFNWSITALW